MKRIRAVAMLGVIVATASCAPKPQPEPARPPVRTTPLPPPTPAPPPPQPALGWEDLPLTPGDWRYRSDGPAAVFESAGQPLFTVQCDRAARQVSLVRAGAAGPVTVRTTYGDRSLAAGTPLPASDPLLDNIAFSRGRIAVEAQGQARLILPSWPETARVTEDCRG